MCLIRSTNERPLFRVAGTAAGAGSAPAPRRVSLYQRARRTSWPPSRRRPASGSFSVRPVERPQVANAEITSKSTWSSGALVICRMTMLDTATIVAPHSATATDSRSTSIGMRRRNASIDSTPRASANAARKSTASVVTLMPPAVDAEPPPMNMSMSVTSRLDPCSSSDLDGREPARAASSSTGTTTGRPCARHPGGRRSWDCRTRARCTARRPATSRMAEVSSVSFTWIDQRRRRLRRRRFGAIAQDHREPDRAEEDADHQGAEEPVVRRRTA